MKGLKLDWIADDTTWTSGIVVRNWHHSPSPVQIFFAPMAGPPSYETLLPWSYCVPTIPQNVNSSAVILGGDLTEVVMTTRNIGGGFSFIAPREVTALEEIIFPYYPDVNWEWRTTPFWTALKGNLNPLRYNRALQMQAVQLAAIKTYFQFADRKDRALGVMDGCPLIGDAPTGHPSGAHSASHGAALDVSYYTMNSNNTQIGQNPETIFSNGNLNSNFDLKRNARFFELISEYLPEVMIMVDERIARALGFPSYLQGDSVPSYKHDQHAHIVMGGRINEDALL